MFKGKAGPASPSIQHTQTSSTMNSQFLLLGGIGMQEILLIGLFILIFFGAKKIPEFMRGMGKGINQFKEGMKGLDEDSGTTTTKKPSETTAGDSEPKP